MNKIFTLVITCMSLVALSQGPAGTCVFMDFEAFDQDGILRYINCGNDDVLNPGEQLTIEAWSRINDSNWNQKICGKTNGNFNSGYVFAIDQGDVYGEIWNPGLNEIHDGFIPPVQLWYHMVITFEAGNVMRGYVNGEMVQEINVSGNEIATNSDPFIIGIAPWDLANFQTFGELDEIRLWDVALSEEQIKENMFLPLDGNEDGLIAYYQFDEGSGTEASDSGPYGNDGTFVGLTTSDWVSSRAPLGDEEMMNHTNVVGLWNGVTFADPRFVITDNGLSMTASGIPDLDYCVFGHDEGSGVTIDGVPGTAPANFERTSRIWYSNVEGEFWANLTFNLTNAAGGGTILDNGQPANHYTLMRRTDDGMDFDLIAQGDDLNGAIVTFEDVYLQNGYYTIGVGDAPADVVGIEEIGQSHSFSVYPNPTTDTFSWNFSGELNENVLIQVFDELGKMVSFKRVAAGSSMAPFDVRVLSSGTYVVRLETTHGVFEERLIIR